MCDLKPTLRYRRYSFESNASGPKKVQLMMGDESQVLFCQTTFQMKQPLIFTDQWDPIEPVTHHFHFASH